MDSVYEIVERARKTGKIEKGTNEVTKSVERGTAKLVVIASDVTPKEIVQHLPVLCKERGIPCLTADSKQKLGSAANLSVATAAIVIIDAGDASGMISGHAKEAKAGKEATDKKHEADRVEKAEKEKAEKVEKAEKAVAKKKAEKAEAK